MLIYSLFIGIITIVGLYVSFTYSIHSIFPLIAATGNMFLAGFVYSRDRKNSVNTSFLWLALSLGIMEYAIYGLFVMPDADLAYRWGVFFSAALAFIPIYALQFILSITHNKGKTGRNVLRIMYVFAIVFTVLLWTGLMVNKYVKVGWKFSPEMTPVYSAFLLYVIGGCILALIALMSGYMKAGSDIEKNQLKYLLFACVITLIIGFSNIFLSMGIKVYPFGSLGFIAFSGIIAYAIGKHNLMDISVVIKRSIVYAALTIIITGFYAGIVGFFHSVFGVSSSGKASWILNAFSAMIIAVGFQPLRSIVQRWVDRIFFMEKVDYYKTLKEFSLALGTVIELNSLLSLIMDKVTETIHIDKSFIMLDNEEGEYKVVVSRGIEEAGNELVFNKSGYLCKSLITGRKVFNVEEARFHARHRGWDKSAEALELKELLDTLEKSGVTLCVPLIVKNKLTGIFALGGKKNEKSYGTTDYEILMIVASQAAIAIENARLYSNMRQLEKNLYHSDKLAAIGTLAASLVHEIRTPVCSIQGFCQMLPRMYNNQAFLKRYEGIISKEMERLNAILERLLNFSKPIADLDSPDKVRNIIEEILLLINKEISHSHVRVKADYEGDAGDVQMPAEGLKQVFLNIILNAIHATPRDGFISIRLNKEFDEGYQDKVLVIEIEDTGEGIPVKDIEKIFSPFYTTKKTGTGLGMPISKRIINEFSGTIVVKSELGKGTTFTIRVPVDYNRVKANPQKQEAIPLNPLGDKADG